MIDRQWFNCYSKGWGKGDISPGSFSHPAKFSKQLIRRIYEHLLAEGYVKPGSVVADPFGGVALGSFWAMRNGLHWRGVELEARFVELGQGNIDLWNGRYAAHFPGWGSAVLLQGDSRRLAEVLGGAGCVVSSPPFLGVESQRDDGFVYKDGSLLGSTGKHYGRSPGQLGSMPEGTAPAAIVSSPPFVNQLPSHDNFVAPHDTGARMAVDYDTAYGSTPGQLANLPPGDISAVISSPPYADAVSNNGEGPGARHDFTYHNGTNATKNSSANGYGLTEGNLGNLAAVVSSPPFEKTNQSVDSDFLQKRAEQHRNGSRMQPDLGTYGQTPGNLGNDTAETFWTAARTILTQCHQILAPGGVAVWVTGNFRRDGKIVDFGGQWLALCESVGFVGLEHITAWKVERRPAQADIFGNVHNRDISRVSFFRRLDNQKNPGEEIESEDVWIVQNPLHSLPAEGAAG